MEVRQMGAAKSIYEPACEEALDFLRILYGSTLAQKPKERDDRTEDADLSQKDYGWTFIGMTEGSESKEIKFSVGLRTYRTLWKYIYDDRAVFITPNQFISRTQRTETMLEWINAIVVDFDDTQNVVDALERMKLPQRSTPTVVNKTKKGLHFWYVFDKPVKATLGNQGRYKTIARAMAITARADQQCQSPTQFFRIPRNIQVYQPDARVSFNKLYVWAKAVLKKNRDNTKAIGSPAQLIKSEAFNTVLQGISEGGRNTAAYSLAMVYRNADVSKVDALDTLMDWNRRNDPPLSEKKITEVVDCVYKRKADRRLPINNIKLLSGKSFKFGRIITQKKDRSKRERTHYSEWLSDLLDFIQRQPERSWEGSQKALADDTGIPLRSLKEVLLLVKKGNTDLQMKTVGSGCKAKTILSYPVPQIHGKGTQNSEYVPQNSDFVPQTMPKSQEFIYSVVQNQGSVPQKESNKGEKIKFVPQFCKAVLKSGQFVPQIMTRGENEMQIATSVETQRFESVQSRNKGYTAGGWPNHPRRGFLLRGAVVCRTQRGLSPQHLHLKVSSRRNPVGPLGLVGCRPKGAQSTNQVVHRARDRTVIKQSTETRRKV